MKGFVEGPEDKFGNRKIVNLDQVTNICFEQYTDRYQEKKWKVIFNFSYGISLKDNLSKIIPDYCYFIYNTDTLSEYKSVKQVLNNQVNSGEWIAPLDKTIDRIVNKDFVSFIATDPRKNRIIVNLTTGVSFHNNYSQITSDFVYFDFSTPEKYVLELKYMKDLISVN